MAKITKLFMLTDEVLECICGYSNPEMEEANEETETPPDPSGKQYIEVSNETLGGLTPLEFLQQKAPVFSGDPPVFQSWADLSVGPTVALVGAGLKSDGKNHIQINLSGGPASVAYKLKFSRDVSRNGSLSGTLNVNGDKANALRISAFGEAELKGYVYSEAGDFKEVEFSIPITNVEY